MANELARKMRNFTFGGRPRIKNFIVDFACYHPRVIVELDGSQHAQGRHSLRDKSRDTKLEADGFTIIRIWNNEVDTNLEGVFDRILHVLETSRPPTPASQGRRRTSPPGGG